MTASIMNHLEIEMTNDNDLIRRGDAALAVLQNFTETAQLEAIAAIPAVAASPPADPVINVDSRQPEQMYLICKYGGYYRPNCRGYTSSTDEAGRYTLAEAERETHPNGPVGPRDGMTYIPAPPVNADSRQRVTVDSLATLMFNEWKRVDPRSKVAMFPVSYMSTFADMARAVLAAINMQPGPRDAQIAALVEAAKPFAQVRIKNGVSQAGDIGRTDVTNLRAALAAVKGGDA